MIVDTHVHYSEPPSAARPYDQQLAATDKKYTMTRFLSVDEVVAAAKQVGIDRVVQVTNTKMGYDNRYALEGVAKYPDMILGVIGRFDPLAPNIESRLREYCAQPGMLGVRFTLLTAANKPWMRDGTLDPFMEVAQKLDVPITMYAPGQVAEMGAMARRFRGVRFLFDHMGIENEPPRPQEEVFRNWNDVIALAKEPNIWMKPSFFPEASHGSERYPFPKGQKYFQRLYEEVGASRFVWGANFPPVENVHCCTYQQALDFIRKECTFLSDSDRAAILGGNFLQQFRVLNIR